MSGNTVDFTESWRNQVLVRLRGFLCLFPYGDLNGYSKATENGLIILDAKLLVVTTDKLS
jgi:hypothetical protein